MGPRVGDIGDTGEVGNESERVAGDGEEGTFRCGRGGGVVGGDREVGGGDAGGVRGGDPGTCSGDGGEGVRGGDDATRRGEPFLAGETDWCCRERLIVKREPRLGSSSSCLSRSLSCSAIVWTVLRV